MVTASARLLESNTDSAPGEGSPHDRHGPLRGSYVRTTVRSWAGCCTFAMAVTTSSTPLGPARTTLSSRYTASHSPADSAIGKLIVAGSRRLACTTHTGRRDSC